MMDKPWNNTRTELLLGAIQANGLEEVFREAYSACQININPRSDKVIKDVVNRICDKYGVEGEGARGMIRCACRYM